MKNDKTRIAELLKENRKEIVNQFYDEYCLYILNVDLKKRDIHQLRRICTPFKHRLSLILDKFINILLSEDEDYAIAESESDTEYALKFFVPRNRELNSSGVLRIVKSFQDVVIRNILNGTTLSEYFIPEEKVINILNELVYIVFEDLWVSSVVGFKHQHSVIQGLLSKLMKTQEDERQRLWAEIHDDFLPILALIPLKLEIMEELSYHDIHAMRKELNLLSKIVRETTSDIRNSRFDLNLFWTEKKGLVFSLNTFVRRFQQEFKIPVVIDVCKMVSKLKGYSGVTLFRIIQEALFNAGKHSNANSVQVRISVVDEVISVLIEDDGIGFNLGRVRNARFSKDNFGLILMEERTRLLKGTLRISSEKQFGTKITVKIPASVFSFNEPSKRKK